MIRRPRLHVVRATIAASKSFNWFRRCCWASALGSSLAIGAVRAEEPAELIDNNVVVALQPDPAKPDDKKPDNVPELPDTNVEGMSRPRPQTAPRQPSPPEPPPNNPQDNPPTEGYGVTGRNSPLTGQTNSASEGVIGQTELQTRPIQRSTSVLELVPGLIVADHAGGGEAGQFFIRGMYLDHGNDISIKVDGMPVNLPTGAIAQGYVDTNFIIPELLERINFRKGPYYTDVGDFSTAGSVEFVTAKKLPYGIAKAQFGEWGFARGVLANSEPLGNGELLYAFETQFYDGPFLRDEDLHKVSGQFRYTIGDECCGMSISAMLYNNNWFNTLQIPERAFTGGVVPLFGTLSPTDFSNTQRYVGNLEWWNSNCCYDDKANVYVQYYDVNSFQNFTIALDDPINGDQRQFLENRVTVGANFSRSWETSQMCGGKFTVGMQTRYDHVPGSQFNATNNQALVDQLLFRDFDLFNIAGYAQNEIRWNDQWRSIVGVRADYFQHDVTDRLQAVNSGDVDDHIVSPKGSLIYSPFEKTEVFLNAGYAFHTNHAGATTTVVDRFGAPTDPSPLIVRTFGAEIGTRTEAIEGLQSGAVFFYSKSDSELIFEADEGILEPQRATERFGIDTNHYLRWSDWLAWDADFTASHARFVEFDPAGDFVPNAPTVVFTSGPLIYWTEHVYTSLRYRCIGTRPLIEDNSVRAGQVDLFNLQVGYRSERLQATVDVLNLFNSRDRDIEYFYATQLPGEAGPVDDRVFRPLEARALRASVTWLF